MPTRPAPGAPYQVLDHGFDLFLGHVYILCGAFQGDPVLALRELDVDLPHQNKSRPTGMARPQQPPMRAWAALPGQQPIHRHQEKLERRSGDGILNTVWEPQRPPHCAPPKPLAWSTSTPHCSRPPPPRPCARGGE